MRAVNALETLELLGSSQWGLVTTSQARAAGLSNVQLARLADQGTLARVRHGVYALPSAGADPLQDLRAAWLSASREGQVVVSGASAAAVHQLGDVLPSRHEFTASTRRQSAQPDVRFHRADVADEDVVLVDGLPVTSVQRTVADLTDQALDADHLSDVLADAVTRSGADPRALASALNRNASHYFASSGAQLLADLAPSTASYWNAVTNSLAHGLAVNVSHELRDDLAAALVNERHLQDLEQAFTDLAHTALKAA